MSDMNAYLSNLDQIESWFFNLAEKQLFFLPKKTQGVNYRFEPIDHQQSLDLLNYKPTILPPGKNIFPDDEILFSYYKDDDGHYQFSQGVTVNSQLLAGVRACDLKGVYLLDEVFSDGVKDSHYLRRREKTDIIAFNCMTPCDDHCFCEAAQSLDFQMGADIFITPLFSTSHKGQANEEQQCLLEVLTPRGNELIKSLESTECSSPQDLKNHAIASRPQPFGRQFSAPIEQLAKAIHQKDADSVYQQYAEQCFSCGTCNLVCPTCYCFETKDELNLDGSSGKKTRHWDACLSPGFAEVAGGHNFRAEPAARQHHRIRRKFDYLPQRFEQTFCTGCGRCGRQCTTGIDIFNIVNDVYLSVQESQE